MLVRVALVVGASALLLVAPRGMAQTAACDAAKSAEDAFRDLAKEAFLEAVGEAGVAMGEKGLRLAEAGRGTAGGRLVELGERAHFGAELAGTVDDLIIDPIKEYMESPAEEAADRAFGKLMEGVGKVVFPTAGIALDAGRFVIGTARWTVEEMYDAGRRQQIEATIFGRGSDIALGSINNLLAQDPFFDSGPVRNRRVSRDSVGRDIRSEEELRKLWFEHYRGFLLGGPMGLGASSRAEVDTALTEGWPHLKRYWAFKRAEIVVKEMRSAFGARMSQMQQRVARGESPCPTPTPTVAAVEPAPRGVHLVLVDVTTEPANLVPYSYWTKIDARKGSTSGGASANLHGSTSEYTWSVPAYLDGTPRPAKVSGDAKSAKNAYGHWARMGFNIGLYGSGVTSDKPLPVGIKGTSEEGKKVSEDATVQVSVPRVAGARVTLKVAVNFSFAIVFHYAEPGR